MCTRDNRRIKRHDVLTWGIHVTLPLPFLPLYEFARQPLRVHFSLPVSAQNNDIEDPLWERWKPIMSTCISIMTMTL